MKDIDFTNIYTQFVNFPTHHLKSAVWACSIIHFVFFEEKNPTVRLNYRWVSFYARLRS